MEPWSRCSERAWYRRPSMARVLLWSVWLALASAACSSPVTQLVVVVRSDLPPSDLAEVSVGVIPGEPFTSAPATQHFDIATGQYEVPFSFGVLPRNGDATGRVEITVSAIGADGSTTVSRVVRTGFSAGRTLEVPVFLGASCRDRTPCPLGATCDAGECVSIDVPVEILRPVTPGREFDDAGTPDGGGVLPSLPPPTVREVAPLAAVPVATSFLVAHPGGDVFLGVTTDPAGASGGVLGASGTERPGGHVLRIGPDRSVRWSRSFLGSAMVLSHGALDGERLLVCGDYDGTLTPDGGAALTATDDGTLDRDDAAFLAELDATTGALRWAVPLASGNATRCSDLVVSGGLVGVGLFVSSALRFDGAPATLGGCSGPSSVFLRVDASGARPVARGGMGYAQTAQNGVALESDGSGGFLVGVTFFGAGDQLAGGGCFAGPVVSGGVARYDGSGVRLWATRALEYSAFAGLGVDVARTGDRVVVTGSMGSPVSGMADIAILVDGVEVSPASQSLRMYALGLRLGDGGHDGVVRIGRGWTYAMPSYAAGGDVLLCGLVTSAGADAGSVDLFGMSVPSDGPFFGFAVVLRPDLSARWVETAVGDTSGIVTACAPAADRSVWAGAVVASSGTAFGSAASGGVLAHLSP